MEYFDVKTVLGDKINKILKQQNSNLLSDNDKHLKEVFEDICEEMDGKIPKEIGEMLIKENNNPDYTILIHRTSRTSKEEFFNNGLVIAGGNDLDYTTNRYKNDLSLLINVANASKYKSNNYNTGRCIIMKIPNTSLNYEKGKTKPILFQTDNIAEQSGGMVVLNDGTRQTILLPEYILGSIEFNEKNEISHFASNPNYTNIHDYKNNGLVCPKETIYSYINQNEDKKENLNHKDINEIICKENTDYMNGKYIPKETSYRKETEIKEYSKKGMFLSKFKQISQKIKSFFTKDKNKEENEKTHVDD